MTSLGVRVTVLSDVGPVTQGENGCEENVEVVKCWKPDDPLSLLRALFKIVKLKMPVVVFNLHFAIFGRSRTVNFFGFLMVGATALLGKILHFKTLVLLHNLPDAIKIDYFGLKTSLLNRAGLLLAEKMTLWVDSVIVTTRINKKLIEQRFRRQAIYIPHGAWMLTPVWDGAPPSKKDSLLFLGYISPAKDMSLLSRVYRSLKLKYPWLKLKLVTSPHPNFPESIEELKELYDIDGVEYLGYKREEELPQILRSCVALILPYITCTGSSGVLHLVSGFGLPTVAPDLPEFRESRYDGAGILLCKDEAEMVQTIELLINDAGLWHELSRRSRKFAEQRSWNNVASMFLKLIESLGKG